MINFNGEITDVSAVKLPEIFRAFRYGDGVFETIKYAHGKILFLEDHYFRLMSSMRILRMNIPMHFSPEYLEEQIIETIAANHAEKQSCRVRLQVFRSGEGTYLPSTHDISFLIEISILPHQDFVLNDVGLNIDVFKDHFVQAGLLNNLKSSNALVYVLASIYAKENDMQELVLLNDAKQVAEGISSNIFILQGEKVITPPISSGCTKGIIRKNMLQLLPKMGLEVVEENFSPFDLQRADEVWFTNTIQGLRWAATFRKKTYTNATALRVLDELNGLL